MVDITTTMRMMKTIMIIAGAMEEEVIVAEEETTTILNLQGGNVHASSGRVPTSALTVTGRCYCE